MSFFDESNSIQAQWYTLVKEAIAINGYNLEESLENYLIITLDRFTREDGLARVVVALDLLRSMQLPGREKGDSLRTVGDECLLLSGLFPERALKKNVSLHYLVGMGKQAYSILGECYPSFISNGELFIKLSYHFVGLMDVLHAMRRLSHPTL